jgi:hypothetical protein
MQRLRAEFGDPDVVSENLGADPLTFTYTDGGVFQNEPLGMAKDFVDEIDNHLDSEKRAYLFVCPDPKSSTAHRAFDAKSGNFRTMFSTLATAILYESRFQDWIRAEKVNEQIDLFNTRALALKDLFKSGVLTARASEALTSVLLKRLVSGEDSTDEARTQLRAQFRTEYDELVNTPGLGKDGADVWIDAVLVLELAANLHEKDEMYIYTATASSQELAGAQLMAFLGFLDQDYRQHDYDVGRTKAQELLSSLGARDSGPLPVLRYTPQPIRAIDPALAGSKITDAPIQKRKALRDRLKNRADIILKEANLPMILRGPLELFYVNGKISELLGL